METLDLEMICHREAARLVASKFLSSALDAKVQYVLLASDPPPRHKLAGGPPWQSQGTLATQALAAVAAAGQIGLRQWGLEDQTQLRIFAEADKVDLRDCVEFQTRHECSEAEIEYMFQLATANVEALFERPGVNELWHGIASVLLGLYDAGWRRIDSDTVDEILRLPKGEIDSDTFWIEKLSRILASRNAKE